MAASQAPGEPSCAGPMMDGLARELATGLLDRPRGVLVLFALERVGGLGSEGAVWVGDVPARPVLLDGERGLLSPAAAVVAGRAWARGGGEVGGPGVAISVTAGAGHLVPLHP